MNKGGRMLDRDKILTGAAGEYYVAFRLSAMGYAVGVTTRGARAIDLVVANPKTAKSVTVQTKTMFQASGASKYGGYWNWRVGVASKPVHRSFFYVFVDLKGDISKVPDVFIVPSRSLLSLVQDWPDKKTGEIVDRWAGIDQGSAEERKYKNRWNILERALR